jgi:hypothetical protein
VVSASRFKRNPIVEVESTSNDNYNFDESNYVVYDMGGNVNNIPFYDSTSDKEIQNKDDNINNTPQTEKQQQQNNIHNKIITYDDDDDEYLKSINPNELYNIDTIYNNTYKNPIYYLNRVHKFIKRNNDLDYDTNTNADNNADNNEENANEIDFFEFGSQLDGFSLFVYETLIDMAFSSTKGVKLSYFYQYGVNYFDTITDKEIAPLISSGYSAFTYDYPEVWWHKKIGFSVCVNTKNQVTKVAFQIVSDLDPSQITEMTTEIDYETDRIIKSAPHTTDFENLKYIHDTLITNIEYNMTANYRFSIYGALVEHRAVCEGYGESFKLLARKLGIDVICVPSDEHLWNFARLGDKWYVVDVTFDDPGTTDSNGKLVYESGNGDNIDYTYFLVGQDFFKKHPYSIESHTINKSLTHISGAREFEFPQITEISYIIDYRNQFGTNLIASALIDDATTLYNPIRKIMMSFIIGLILYLIF